MATPFADHAPFPGFDQSAFRFLRQLKKNNRRDWFTAERKETYSDQLLEPMRQLLAEIRTRVQAEGLPYNPDPARGIFRLYRDTRFSPDKTPYKTHVGAVIPFRDEPNKGIGNYIHIDPTGCFFGGGAWFMEPVGLRRLRAAIDRDHAKLRKILGAMADTVGPLEGAQLQRAPSGFDETHPAIDLLRYKQMWCGHSFSEDLASTPELVDWIVEMTRHLTPFNQFLWDAMRG